VILLFVGPASNHYTIKPSFSLRRGVVDFTITQPISQSVQWL